MPDRSNFRKFSTMTTLCLITLLQGCGQEIDARQTQDVNGLLYKLNDSDPFTGKITNINMGFIALKNLFSCNCEIKVKKGLKDGALTCNSIAENGIKVTAGYKEGAQDGLEEISSSKTGNVISRINYANGRKNGVEEYFDPTSKALLSQTNWENGKKSGSEKKWDPSGKTVLVDLNWHDEKQSGYDKSGESEEIFKNGKRDGTIKTFKISPTSNKKYLSSEKLYKEGILDGASKNWDENGNVWLEIIYKNNVPQSKLAQQWANNKVIETESGINISAGGTDPSDSYFVKDGKEHYNHEIGGGILVDMEVDWSKGKPIRGSRKESKNGKPYSIYQGIANSQEDRLVKDGIEKKWDDNGELAFEVMWDKGIALKITSKMKDGQFETIDHPSIPLGEFPTENFSKTY